MYSVNANSVQINALIVIGFDKVYILQIIYLVKKKYN